MASSAELSGNQGGGAEQIGRRDNGIGLFFSKMIFVPGREAGCLSGTAHRRHSLRRRKSPALTQRLSTLVL
jgi:hypothetical protein